MPRPAILLKRCLIFVHRRLGVALSILFFLWFVSGIVMMYWGFPGITRTDRLSRAPVLDPGQVRISPEEAYARGSPTQGGFCRNSCRGWLIGFRVGFHQPV
jgi:hypothetical protein